VRTGIASYNCAVLESSVLVLLASGIFECDGPSDALLDFANNKALTLIGNSFLHNVASLFFVADVSTLLFVGPVSHRKYNPLMSELRIGTSAFTAAGWPGTFYPEGMKPADYLTYYATKFDTVEVDSTFYHSPPASTVMGWNAKTPKSFLFALKIPQLITHEKCLVDCQSEFHTFLKAADLLGDKLGTMLFQFGYFNKKAFASGEDFLAVLKPFLKKLPKSYRFGIEIRNKAWLNAEFADLLREHEIALTLQDQIWMPLPSGMPFDYLTADFTYIRLLGDRKGIEKETKTWEKVIVDRKKELRSWVDVCQQTVKRGVSAFVYVNNHYSGHAPKTVADFLKLWGTER
jgi:uncharacterized protein YecE (DUF72 family)